MIQKSIPFQSTTADAPIELPSTPAQKQATKSISILIGGAAGTGIKTLETLLSLAFRANGYHLFSTKEYMSRVRGGSNTTLLRVGDGVIAAPCWQIDLSIALDADALEHMHKRFSNHTLIFADEAVKHETLSLTALPMVQKAKEHGSTRYANSYAAGIIAGLFELDETLLIESMQTIFDEVALEGNTTLVKEGFADAKRIQDLTLPPLPTPSKQNSTLHLLDGSSASGFGFLAGGCNMMTAYPMSPSTGVLNFMASMSEHFTLAVEQSEDEIASLNMVLGGWYGGGRAMTSTSGGGFALMSEAMSLSGISETPAVIYLAQRPGPATGLPTRTEQGDLALAIHSGHGYFGRIVLAPGSLQECIDYGYLAFELADRYQMPVACLSDQYLADTIGMIASIDFSAYEQRRYIQPTDASYTRYTLGDAHGISPRGIPGLGEGIIAATSDEHNARGQITESAEVRKSMVEKRQAKIARCTSEAFVPTLSGEGSIALIGWGSSKGAIEEVLHALNGKQLYGVHFAWVHPLNPEHLAFLKENKANIVIENNVTGQFADILKSHDVPVHHRILQADGFSFFADQLKDKIEQVLKDLS